MKDDKRMIGAMVDTAPKKPGRKPRSREGQSHLKAWVDTGVFDRLTDLCNTSGFTKDFVVSRLVTLFLQMDQTEQSMMLERIAPVDYDELITRVLKRRSPAVRRNRRGKAVHLTPTKAPAAPRPRQPSSAQTKKQRKRT